MPTHSSLENPRDGGTWWAAVYGVAQSRTRLKWLSSSSYHLKFSTETSVTKDRLTREEHMDVSNRSFYVTQPSQGSEWRPEEAKSPSGFMLGWMKSGKSWKGVIGQSWAELSRRRHFASPDWLGSSWHPSVFGDKDVPFLWALGAQLSMWGCYDLLQGKPRKSFLKMKQITRTNQCLF